MRIIWRRRADMEEWIKILETLAPLLPYGVPIRPHRRIDVRMFIPEQRRATP